MRNRRTNFYFWFYSLLLLLTDVNGHCGRPYYVKEGESCQNIQTRYSLTNEEFEALNPMIDCENLFFGVKLCLKASRLETRLNLNSTTDLHHDHHHIKDGHLIPELRLGRIEIGNVTLPNVDLNKKESQWELREIVERSFAAVKMTEEGARLFLQKMDPATLGRTVAKLMTLFTAVAPVVGAVGAVVLVFIPEESVTLLKELKEVMLKEFGKVDIRFNKIEYLQAFHDFRSQIADKIGTGMFILKKFWKLNTKRTLETFQDWCSLNPPNDLASKFSERLQGPSATLNSLRLAMPGDKRDEKEYTRIESWLHNLLKSLTILSSSCEQLHPMASENVIKEEYERILRDILSLIEESKNIFRDTWQSSAKLLAQEIIDRHPKNNDEIVKELFTELENKYVGYFYVAVYDYNTLFPFGYSSYCNRTLAFSSNYKGKAYRIARSSCQQPTDVVDELPDAVLVARRSQYSSSTYYQGLTYILSMLEYYEEWHCKTSSMIGVVLRERLVPIWGWEYSHYRPRYHGCAVRAGVVRAGAIFVAEYAIVSL